MIHSHTILNYAFGIIFDVPFAQIVDIMIRQCNILSLNCKNCFDKRDKTSIRLIMFHLSTACPAFLRG